MASDGSAVGVYAALDQAEAAVRRLDEHGFAIGNVSIVARDLTSEREIRGFISTGDVAKRGAGVGGWMGGIFGLLVGAALIWVPGFGPLLVAGPLAAIILGGMEGAAVGAAGGGLLGALVGLGVSREHILKYEDHLRGGRYLVIAHGSPADVSTAEEILRKGQHLALESYHPETSDLAPVT
ncbi:MAG: general stress protein [Candidatus Limnocylindrales bacterium]